MKDVPDVVGGSDWMRRTALKTSSRIWTAPSVLRPICNTIESVKESDDLVHCREECGSLWQLCVEHAADADRSIADVVYAPFPWWR